jgi:hypothetical protein
MIKAERAETYDEGRKPRAPEPRQCVLRRAVALGHPPVSGRVARADFEDDPGMVGETTREEVSRGKSHRAVTF